MRLLQITKSLITCVAYICFNTIINNNTHQLLIILKYYSKAQIIQLKLILIVTFACTNNITFSLN